MSRRHLRPRRKKPRPRPRPKPRPEPQAKPMRKDTFALIVGIEYTGYAQRGTLDRLPGCHADANSMQHILRTRFGVADFNILSDSGPAYTQPTKANICNALKHFAQISSKYKHMILYYSGHGTQVRDSSGDEADHHDECVVPCDFLSAGHITDDYLLKNVLRHIDADTKCTLITDCCNSGTLFDLKFQYVGNGNMKPLNKQSIAVKADIITLSGCKDPQTSASAYNLQRKRSWRGAMTYAMETTLSKHNYKCSWQTLLGGVHAYLTKNNFSQKPQVCSSSLRSLANTAFLF